jgi:hypothetical protein
VFYFLKILRTALEECPLLVAPRHLRITSATMNRLWGDNPQEQAYEPLEGGSERPDGERIEENDAQKFSWTDYSVFLLLGVAMLWAW